MTAAHLHLILNHLPLFGLLAALVPLVAAGLFQRSRELVLVGLAMGALFGAATPLVVLSGEEAEERIEAGLDAAGRQWLHIHEERAEVVAPLVYVTAGLCLAGLVALRRRPEWQRPVAGTASGALLVAVVALGWVGAAGGQVAHPELRPGVVTPSPGHEAGGGDEDFD